MESLPRGCQPGRAWGGRPALDQGLALAEGGHQPAPAVAPVRERIHRSGAVPVRHHEVVHLGVVADPPCGVDLRLGRGVGRTHGEGFPGHLHRLEQPLGEGGHATGDGQHGDTRRGHGNPSPAVPESCTHDGRQDRDAGGDQDQDAGTSGVPRLERPHHPRRQVDDQHAEEGGEHRSPPLSTPQCPGQDSESERGADGHQRDGGEREVELADSRMGEHRDPARSGQDPADEQPRHRVSPVSTAERQREGRSSPRHQQQCRDPDGKGLGSGGRDLAEPAPQEGLRRRLRKPEREAGARAVEDHDEGEDQGERHDGKVDQHLAQPAPVEHRHRGCGQGESGDDERQGRALGARGGHREPRQEQVAASAELAAPPQAQDQHDGHQDRHPHRQGG